MTEICKLNEIPDGGMRPVIVEKHSLVLVRRGDDVYALLDKCPHQGAPLSCGVVTCRRRIDTAGDYHAEKDGLIVRCPWHNWEIDVTDGSACHADNVRVRTFPVVIENGVVCVEV